MAIAPELMKVRLLVLFGAVLASKGEAMANAPPGQYEVAGDTVKDIKTGLTWQRTVTAAPTTWSGATEYCAQLALSGGGWRLPGMRELLTLVDPTRSFPAIDVSAFPNTPSALFWSVSGSSAGRPSAVGFDAGSSSSPGSDTMCQVRCVR